MSFAFDEIQVTEVPVGTIVRLVFKDTLKKEDYEQFVPMVEKSWQHLSSRLPQQP